MWLDNLTYRRFGFIAVTASASNGNSVSERVSDAVLACRTMRAVGVNLNAGGVGAICVIGYSFAWECNGNEHAQLVKICI